MASLESLAEKFERQGYVHLDLPGYGLQVKAGKAIEGGRFMVLTPRITLLTPQGVATAPPLSCPLFDEKGGFTLNVYFVCVDSQWRRLFPLYVEQLRRILKSLIQYAGRLRADPAAVKEEFLRSLDPAEKVDFLVKGEAARKKIFLEKSRFRQDREALQTEIAGFLQASCMINARAYSDVEALRQKLAQAVEACQKRRDALGADAPGQRRQKAVAEIRKAVERLSSEADAIVSMMFVAKGETHSSERLLVPGALMEYYEVTKEQQYQLLLLERLQDRF